MSDVSQLASRVGGEGEWGSELPISLHYLAQVEGQEGELRSLPLTKNSLHIYTDIWAICTLSRILFSPKAVSFLFFDA